MSSATPAIAVAGRLVRVLAPKWAVAPESGEGAAVRGARYNPQGRAALYLSFELSVAANEYGQDLKPRAGTFCYYDVDLSPVADLTSDETLEALAIRREVLSSSWKKSLSNGQRPITWDIAERLIGLGFIAAQYESVLAENRPPTQPTPGLNIVIWKWSAIPGQRVVALDPSDDLPRNQASWQP